LRRAGAPADSSVIAFAAVVLVRERFINEIRRTALRFIDRAIAFTQSRCSDHTSVIIGA
jgi:hypothetical protein